MGSLPSNGVGGHVHEVNRTLSTCGHGTIVVESRIEKRLCITVRSAKAYPRLWLEVKSDSARIYIKDADDAPPNLVEWSSDCAPTTPRHFLTSERVTTYWLSLDRSNGELRYGKYFVNATTMYGKITGEKRNGTTAL